MAKKKHQETVVEKTGQYISTLDAAKMCGVSTFSIQRWFDDGKLIGARLPGGKRKIAAESLRRFMKEHGLLPSESATAKQRRVLIVDRDARTLDVIKDYLAQTGEYLIQTASNGLDAGLAAAEFRPDIIIVNLGIEDIPAVSIIQRIRRSAVTRDAKLIIIASKDNPIDAKDAKKAGSDAVLAKPLDMSWLGKVVGA